MTEAGHVFLAHGNLTQLGCDAWLVPSGSLPTPGTAWRHTVAAEGPPGTPTSWTNTPGLVIPWSPINPDDPRPWVVKTTSASNSPAAKFVEPARQFLNIATAALTTPPRNGRAQPLLALPVTGAGNAGGSKQAGEIVKQLLPVLYEFVESHPIDVALVMKEGAQYAAAQAARAELHGERAWPDLDEAMRRQVDRLAHRADELVLFLGAGVSQAAGLPSWDGLLKTLAGPALGQDDDFARLNALDQARLLKKRLAPGQELGESVAKHIGGCRHYALAHALLAALPAHEVITTNYDTLFETASAAAGRPVDVLPGQPAQAGRRWLLKLHGSVTTPKSIVLTREDYLRYDTDRAALAGLVQGLLLTKHVLFVGFSLQDDNFHRIADAVRRVIHGEPFGTSLAVAGNQLLQEAWATDLHWVELGSVPASARRLEIFLDCLAARTIETSDHLFDLKYAATLSAADVRLREELTRLGGLLEATAAGERQSVAWARVEGLLRRLGWSPRRKNQE